VGAVVSNVSTLVDVAAAVDGRQPVIERLVTVAGAVARPSTFAVPVGTAYESLVAAAGGPTLDRAHFVAGGPMMGALVELDQTVKKTSSALLVLPFESPVIQRRMRSVARQLQLTRAACLKCMMCTEVCPRNLLGHRLVPDRLMRNLAAGVTEDLAAFQGSYLCSECGLCAVYGCVMNLDPCAVNREMKQKLGAAGVPRPEPQDPASARIYEPLRRVPTVRLTARLGLTRYDGPAPLTPFEEPIQRVKIDLAQHLSAPAESQVVVGQAVRAGDLLGEIPSGKLGARMHASVAGTVLSVTPDSVTIELG
jgi:Na+-translocating ferredoxin:NAD+ oxidoreductase RnfC subunit